MSCDEQPPRRVNAARCHRRPCPAAPAVLDHVDAAAGAQVPEPDCPVLRPGDEDRRVPSAAAGREAEDVPGVPAEAGGGGRGRLPGGAVGLQGWEKGPFE